MAGSMIDAAIKNLVETRVNRELERYHKQLIKKAEQDAHNTQRFTVADYLRLYTAPETYRETGD